MIGEMFTIPRGFVYYLAVSLFCLAVLRTQTIDRLSVEWNPCNFFFRLLLTFLLFMLRRETVESFRFHRSLLPSNWYFSIATLDHRRFCIFLKSFHTLFLPKFKNFYTSINVTYNFLIHGEEHRPE